ncbi:MAG: GNAT family N-acetyltransferase [Pseudomonadota bacterium]
MPPKIRPMAPRDTGAVLDMIAALAAFHSDVPLIDEDALTMMAFGPMPCLKVLVAEGDAGLVGYAAIMPTVRLHEGQLGLEVHHLFVKARVRGTGVGKALIDACRVEAITRGAQYLTLGTAPDNDAAGTFYQRRGFQRKMMHAPRFRLEVNAA